MQRHKEYFEKMALEWDTKPKEIDKISSLIDKFDLKFDDLIVDLGTGTGKLIPFIREKIGHHLPVIALDLSLNMLKKAKKVHSNGKSIFINGCICRLPFKSDCFSKTICFATFPHITNQIAGLKEITRITKPKGKIYIAHLMSSKEMNLFHSQMEGVVKYDVLPGIKEFETMISDLPLNIYQAMDRQGLFLLVFEKTSL